MCRGRRAHSNRDLEPFLDEGGGGAGWAVTAAAVAGSVAGGPCQGAEESVVLLVENADSWGSAPAILVLSVWGGSQIILIQEAREQKHLEG